MSGLKNNIKIGIIGTGAMGKGLLYQSSITPGIQCAAVCDIDIRKCINAVNLLQIPYKVAATVSELDEAISRGLVAVCTSGKLIAQSRVIEVVVEASSSIGSGVESVIDSLNSGKHVVLMNAEIDLTFGVYLAQIAQKNGVVCTSCDGDQYGVLKHIIDDIRFWGFDLVMAGNIKGYLDRYANPTMIIPEADKRNLDYRMCTSYTDGTKLNIEMAIIANAYGMVARVPGMYGPAAIRVQDVFQYFDFDKLWENRIPFVDYILGAEPGGGVFVIGYCGNRYQMDMLSYYKMGNGPYYLFYRPYHLCHIEAMHTIFESAECKTFLTPAYGMRTNVYAYAKRDLESGEKLDGIGGYTCYGKIENTDSSGNQQPLPICLADNVVLSKPVARDQRIMIDDIEYDRSRVDFYLYNEILKQSSVTLADNSA